MLPSIKPLRDLVLVQELPAEDDKTPGGIILPGTVRKPVGPVKATVLALGAQLHGNGEIKVDDHVLFDKFSANELGDGQYLIQAKNIIGVVE